jgi:hypothetical protein
MTANREEGSADAMPKSSPGNAFVEYLLPGMLVLAVCILGFQAFGFRLNTVFQGLKDDLSQSVHAAEQQEKAELAARNGAVKQPSLVTGAPSGPTAAMGRGTSLPIDTPLPPNSSIATIGANGITELLATRLDQLIEQWKREGKATEAQANALIQLANAGHQLADAQRLLEQAIEKKEKKVTYNGKDYQVDGFAELFMYHSSTEKDVWTLSPNTAGSVLKIFNEAYQQASRSDIFKDSAIKQEVTNLVVQISAISEALGSSGSGLLNNSSLATEPTLLYRDLTTVFQTSVTGSPIKMPKSTKDASELTHQNSGQICIIGAGSDDGRTCFSN